MTTAATVSAATVPAAVADFVDVKVSAEGAARILRSEIDRRVTPRIPEGSIISFAVDGYRYAALSVGDRWYTTATVSHHLGDKVFESTADFAERVLSRATDIQIATQFSPV